MGKTVKPLKQGVDSVTRATKAAAEVRSIIERVLDLKRQQDELGEDIREIYLEARQRGWNKTSLGQAVSVIRKRGKDADAFDAAANDTALYLQAYYGTGTLLAPHAHEALPPHNPETGEIETEVQRGQADKPTAPAPKGDEPRASEQGALASASGAVQGRFEPTAPPTTDDDISIPTYLQRGHPDNAWASPAVSVKPEGA